jgi:hypothetical protein
MRRNRFLLSILIASLVGCRPADREREIQGIEAYGLIESPIDHPALEAAIHSADLILGSSSGSSFTPGWKPSPTESVIRVFAAEPKGLGETEVMSSYRQCHCVIVQVGRLSSWQTQQTGTGQALLDLDSETLLVYMLLHEMGHIVHGDVVGTVASSKNADEAMKFNLSPTTQKEHEIAADQFAAQAIAVATADNGTERGIKGARVGVTLAKLSWNLAEHRLLDNFGITAVHAPSQFYDSGLSHPNLEWRILSVNASISNTDPARALLRDFEASRQVGPSILYQRPHL